ncbi:FAD-binding oxidoreductase [Nocardia colli]|uniref:FAD-binding oxidoreductase n=1 Tax=Nocardia colli TaxID=2545717 RepID=UPI0035DB58EF
MTERILPWHNGGELSPLLDTLRDIVGPAHVLTDPSSMQGYVTDWTGRWAGSAVAVVRPASTAEVSSVAAVCFDAHVPITPQGGNTGLVGGGTPHPGSILLSTRRLDHLESIDPVGRTIAAGAGVTVARADQAAAEYGLRFAVDLASKESATLGGIVATNAGGSRMIRFGDTRSQLLGIEAVLADGAVLSRWNPLVKDNIGYDLPGLLAGSEGTLAVITKVLMKLATPAADASVFLAGVATVDDALRLHELISRNGLIVEAAELMTANGVDLVCRHTAVGSPFDTQFPFYALFEVSAHRAAEDSLVEILAAGADLVEDVAIERRPARRLWQLRESHTETMGRESSTPVIKLDLSIPLGSMSSFVRDVESAFARRYPAVRPIMFGHFVDGNIHINVLDAPPADVEQITDAVFAMVAAHNGSISSESGIGRAKNQWVHLGRTALDVGIMRSIKSAMDPRHILNPGVLFPALGKPNSPPNW